MTNPIEPPVSMPRVEPARPSAAVARRHREEHGSDGGRRGYERDEPDPDDGEAEDDGHPHVDVLV